MHEGCLKILCSVLGVPYDLSNLDTLVVILERHEYLGATKYGGYKGIDYSEGALNKRWLTQPSNVDDGNIFNFHFEKGKHDWALQRYHPHTLVISLCPPDIQATYPLFSNIL